MQRRSLIFLSVLACALAASGGAFAAPPTELAQLAAFVEQGDKSGAFKKMDRSIMSVHAATEGETLTIDVRYREGKPSAVLPRVKTFAESLADTLIEKYKRDLTASRFPYKLYVNSWLATKEHGVQLRILRTRFLPFKPIVESEARNDLVAVEPGK